MTSPAFTAFPSPPVVQAAHESDVDALVELNNRFAAEGKTLTRSVAFGYEHLQDYRVLRDPHGHLLGIVALDEYSPSLVELVSLAVDPAARGMGYGKVLIEAACDLARRRGYPEIFAVSFSDALFLDCGFVHSDVSRYPEKKNRYLTIDRTEMQVAEKHCFTRALR